MKANQTALLAVLGIFGFSFPVFAESIQCIEGEITPSAVTAWRLEAANSIGAGSQDDDAIAENIKACFGTQIPACMQRTFDYVRRNQIADASSDVSIDQDAHKQPPPELLAPGASGLEYVIAENVEQIAADHEWPAVRYKSRHAGGFDSQTPSLLMVYVPGDKVNPPVSYDRWLNFPLPADVGADEMTPSPQAHVPTWQDYASEESGGRSLPRTFTMVTLEKKQAGKPAQVYFQMFNRGTTGSPKFRPQSNSNVTSCYSCHPNGLRAISPLGFHVRDGERALPTEAWLNVKLINSAMDTGGGNSSVSWREAAVADTTTGEKLPLLRPKGIGPTFGPMIPLNATGRTQEFINSCYNTRTTVRVLDIFGRAPGRNNIYKLSQHPSIRWEKVRDSMRCSSCHNNSTRGALNEETDLSQVDFKILVDQSMPLGAHQNPLDQDDPTMPVIDDLTGDERIALANCLRAEFELEQQQVTKWLTMSLCQ